MKNHMDDFQLQEVLTKLSTERDVFLNGLSQTQGQVMMRYCRNWDAANKNKESEESPSVMSSLPSSVTSSKPPQRFVRWRHEDREQQRRNCIEIWRKQARKVRPAANFYEDKDSNILSLKCIDDLLKEQQVSEEAAVKKENELIRKNSKTKQKNNMYKTEESKK